MYVLKARLALSAQSDLIVAITTIHRSLLAKLEEGFGLQTRLSANTEKV